jgi:hypothetical protein
MRYLFIKVMSNLTILHYYYEILILKDSEGQPHLIYSRGRFSHPRFNVHRLISDAQSGETDTSKYQSTHWDGWPVKK